MSGREGIITYTSYRIVSVHQNGIMLAPIVGVKREREREASINGQRIADSRAQRLEPQPL